MAWMPFLAWELPYATGVLEKEKKGEKKKNRKLESGKKLHLRDLVELSSVRLLGGQWGITTDSARFQKLQLPI